MTFFQRIAKLIGNEDADLKQKIPVMGDSLTRHADELRTRHLDRMRDGSCQALPALVYSDIIVAIRRIKNHSINLFEALCYADAEAD